MLSWSDAAKRVASEQPPGSVARRNELDCLVPSALCDASAFRVSVFGEAESTRAPTVWCDLRPLNSLKPKDSSAAAWEPRKHSESICRKFSGLFEF